MWVLGVPTLVSMLALYELSHLPSPLSSFLCGYLELYFLQNLFLILTDLKVHIESAMITLYTLLVPFSFISPLPSFTQSPLLDASTKGVCPSAQVCLLLTLRPYLLKLLVHLDLFLLMSYIFSF